MHRTLRSRMRLLLVHPIVDSPENRQHALRACLPYRCDVSWFLTVQRGIRFAQPQERALGRTQNSNRLLSRKAHPARGFPLLPRNSHWVGLRSRSGLALLILIVRCVLDSEGSCEMDNELTSAALPMVRHPIGRRSHSRPRGAVLRDVGLETMATIIASPNVVTSASPNVVTSSASNGVGARHLLPSAQNVSGVPAC